MHVWKGLVYCVYLSILFKYHGIFHQLQVDRSICDRTRHPNLISTKIILGGNFPFTRIYIKKKKGKTLRRAGLSLIGVTGSQNHVRGCRPRLCLHVSLANPCTILEDPPHNPLGNTCLGQGKHFPHGSLTCPLYCLH